MKLKKLKLFTTFLLVLPLCVVMLGTGCEDEERDPLCYQGKVVNLNQGDGCQNIITITQTAENGELVTNATISFNPDLYEGTLKVDDIVYFKIIEYEEFGTRISTQPCTFPQFAASVEFCNN